MIVIFLVQIFFFITSINLLRRFRQITHRSHSLQGSLLLANKDNFNFPSNIIITITFLFHILFQTSKTIQGNDDHGIFVVVAGVGIKPRAQVLYH